MIFFLKIVFLSCFTLQIPILPLPFTLSILSRKYALEVEKRNVQSGNTNGFISGLWKKLGNKESQIFRSHNIPDTEIHINIFKPRV